MSLNCILMNLLFRMSINQILVLELDHMNNHLTHILKHMFKNINEKWSSRSMTEYKRQCGAKKYEIFVKETNAECHICFTANILSTISWHAIYVFYFSQRNLLRW